LTNKLIYYQIGIV